MNDLPPKHELGRKLAGAYQSVLTKALHMAEQSNSLLHHMLQEVRDDIAALGTFSKDETALLKAYVQRDLTDAASYLDDTGKELKDWLGFDLAQIESELWRTFSAAADRTSLELWQLRQAAMRAGYRTGELAGMGTLLCDQCETALHFNAPGPIPPCPKCRHTQFHRPDV